MVKQNKPTGGFEDCDQYPATHLLSNKTANAALHNEASQHQYDALSYHPAKKAKANQFPVLTEWIWKAHRKCFETDPQSPSCSSTQDRI